MPPPRSSCLPPPTRSLINGGFQKTLPLASSASKHTILITTVTRVQEFGTRVRHGAPGRGATVPRGVAGPGPCATTHHPSPAVLPDGLRLLERASWEGVFLRRARGGGWQSRPRVRPLLTLTRGGFSVPVFHQRWVTRGPPWGRPTSSTSAGHRDRAPSGPQDEASLTPSVSGGGARGWSGQAPQSTAFDPARGWLQQGTQAAREAGLSLSELGLASSVRQDPGGQGSVFTCPGWRGVVRIPALDLRLWPWCRGRCGRVARRHESQGPGGGAWSHPSQLPSTQKPLQLYCLGHHGSLPRHFGGQSLCCAPARLSVCLSVRGDFRGLTGTN